MIFRKHKAKLLLLAFFCLTGLQAQNLNLVEKNGIQTPISTSNIRSITFKSGMLSINLNAGIPISKVLNSVSNINFMPPTGIIEPSQVSNTLLIFPNPTQGIINIDYQPDGINNVDLKVISIDGRVLYAEILKDKYTYRHQIDLSAWQRGLYFVILNNGRTIISEKIIKK